MQICSSVGLDEKVTGESRCCISMLYSDYLNIWETSSQRVSSSSLFNSSSRTGFSAEHPSSHSFQPLRRRRRRTNFNDVEAVAVLLTSKFLPSNELTS